MVRAGDYGTACPAAAVTGVLRLVGLELLVLGTVHAAGLAATHPTAFCLLAAG